MLTTHCARQVAKNDGRITFAHFARILNYIGVIVTAEDFNLLVRKFIKDSYTIDYVDFLKAVDDVKKHGIEGLGPVMKDQHTFVLKGSLFLRYDRPLWHPFHKFFIVMPVIFLVCILKNIIST